MTNNLQFTLATLSDLNEILAVIQDARAFLQLQNSGQWQDGTPSEQTIKSDIEAKQFYVAKFEHHVIGVLALLNHEVAYDHLLTGSWDYQTPYKVIHRFAVLRPYTKQGVASYMLDACETLAKQDHIHLIRVDTHEKNIPMTKLLLKKGYLIKGTTLIEGTKLRIVFEKYLSDRS